MNKTECPPEEDVARAITSAHWDANKNRFSSDLFKGEGISVSRLAISCPELRSVFTHKFLGQAKAI